jgi:hypothetical protein
MTTIEPHVRKVGCGSGHEEVQHFDNLVGMERVVGKKKRVQDPDRTGQERQVAVQT